VIKYLIKESKNDLSKFIREYIENGKVSYVNGFSKDKILSKLKGERPSPSLYLDNEYIIYHLNKFHEGASYLVPSEFLDKYGRSIIGRIDGQFVMTKNELDNLLLESKNNISFIEEKLGLPKDCWKNKEIVRIDIKTPKKLNIRIPSGNETGVNEFWIPGGKLNNGNFEAVLDAIPREYYSEKILKLK
jgi:hypothetical protein